MPNPLLNNFMRCAKCEHFQDDYTGNIDPDIGLCEDTQLTKMLPVGKDLFMLCVHKNFGCIYFNLKKGK